MFKNMKLAAKLGLGFALVALCLVAAVGTTIWQVGRTTAVTDRLIELRAPTAQSSLMMLNGMNHSLAALRGWIILGKDKFKQERAKSWADEIQPSLERMQKFSANWTDPENIERLRIITEKLEDFNRYQKEIEDIAQTVDNTPALKILFAQAAPQAAILAAKITEIIDIELTLEATPERKALLGMMADVRGTNGLALANIRAYLLSGDEKFKKQFDTLWAKNTRRFGDLMKNSTLMTPEQRKAFETFSAARKIFNPLPPKMFEIRGSAEWNLANAWLGTKAAPTAFAIKEKLDAMLGSQQQLMKTDMDEAKRLTSLLSTIEWILLFGGVLFAALIATMITRSITKPINRIIEGLNEGADQVSSASGQVSSSSQSLAEGASEQAASIEETSSSLEEMSSMTKQNADNANQADNLMKEANQVVGQANDSMSELTTSMEEISKASEETSKIIKTIDEIAFQTNLLALNAAVEAARAGEAGAGFAVVADEVRNLAMRAADAAKNTADLIEGTVKKVNDGSELVTRTNEAFTQVADSSSKVGGLVSEIAAASNEQSQGIDQTNTAVAEMDKVVQENAANAEESASASEELNAQAEQMKGMVDELVTIIGGSASRKADDQGATGTPRAKAAIVHHKALSDTEKKAESKEVVVHKARQVRPDQVIPMDEADFKDF